MSPVKFDILTNRKGSHVALENIFKEEYFEKKVIIY